MSAELIELLSKPNGNRGSRFMFYSKERNTFGVLEIKINLSTGHSTVDDKKNVNLKQLASMMETSTQEFVLRMVYVPISIELNRLTVDLRETEYDNVLQLLGLDSLHDLAHTSGMTLDVIPQPANNEKLSELHYSMFVSYYTGIYCRYVHDKSANILLWCNNGADNYRVQTIDSYKRTMLSFQKLAGNPLYMLFVLLTNVITTTDMRLSRVRSYVVTVETHTGYQDWGNLRLIHQLPSTNIEASLNRYIAELTGMVSTIASDRRLMRLAQVMIRKIKEHDQTSPLFTLPEHIPEIPRGDLSVLEDRTEVHLYQCDILEARVRCQILAVQNLKSRHEMRLSIMIAEDSKTLAKSMKILAILTVVFLPATFVASLFSTTMFNWHLSDRDFVSQHFWVYWVIAIPLTAATVSCYLLLINKRRRQRGSFGSDVDEGEELAMLDIQQSRG